MIGVTFLCVIAAASVTFLITHTHACSSWTSLSGGLPSKTTPTVRRSGGPSWAVPLTIKDMTITGLVTVGTPKEGDKEEVFILAINLNSATSWVHSVDLCPGGNCDNENFKAVGGLKSTTFHRKDQQFEFMKKSKYYSGFISEERFKFGSGKGAPEAVLEFFEVTSKTFDYPGYDGVLGLKLKDTDTDLASHAPVVATLLTQLKEPVFGIHIYKVPKDDEHGLMIMGGNDGVLLDGPLHSHNVEIERDGELSGWNIKLDKLLIINTDGTREELRVSVNTASPAPALEDISLPQYTSLIRTILQKSGLSSAGRTLPCDSNLKAMPNIALVMDGVEYVLKPEEYVRRSPHIKNCVLAFQHDDGSKMLLGQVFMKKYYTRFNIKDKQVQFALAKQEL